MCTQHPTLDQGSRKVQVAKRGYHYIIIIRACNNVSKVHAPWKNAVIKQGALRFYIVHYLKPLSTQDIRTLTKLYLTWV